MNDLINKSNQTPIEIALQIDENGMTTAKKLYEFLDGFKSFEDFFIVVSELKVALNVQNLKELRKAVHMFATRFNCHAVVYLLDCIDAEMVLPCRQYVTSSVSERHLQNDLVKNFNNTFPNFQLIGKEVPVNGIGRIDILAKEIKSGRDVIIELKVDSKNPNTQLLAYASVYKNPILIGITEKIIPVNRRHHSITYYTFSQLKELTNAKKGDINEPN